MRRRELTAEDYVRGVREGDRAVLGRAITLVESDRGDDRKLAAEVLHELLPHAVDARRVGISGVPGAGKSTFIEALGCRLIDQGHRVAVLAFDPSSSVSRGSILGDKTRMERLSGREAAFIRPSPSGGSLGGVGRTTRETIAVCEAAGFDVVVVETVGVGQAETLVADMVDTFLVLMLAGAGDELQGIKRGILELADVLAINKADGSNAARASRARSELEQALRILRPPAAGSSTPRVLTCSAVTGDGLDEVWGAIRDHHDSLHAEDLLADRRSRQRVSWMWSMVDERLSRSVREDEKVAVARSAIERDVRRGARTAAEAAAEILRLSGLDRVP